MAGSMTTEQVLALLAEAPARLAAASEGMSAEELRTSPAPGEWSANDILAHLRSCADVRGDSIHVILAEDEPTLKAMSPDTWLERTDYREQDYRASLRAFTAQRANLLAALEPLRPEEWARAATVTAAGKPLRRTVLSYAEWLAIHERPHLKQVERTIAAVRGA